MSTSGIHATYQRHTFSPRHAAAAATCHRLDITLLRYATYATPQEMLELPPLVIATRDYQVRRPAVTLMLRDD